MSTFSQDDAFWMAKALKLAEGGRFSAMPNPNVGCIIVSANGELLGQGYHQRAGEAHAEVNALINAGFTPQNTANARAPSTAGATAYVTLEPCSHVGKTPPCVLALINAQVARVVIASIDKNPLVQNKGIQRLKDAGIRVDTGLMAQQAHSLNVEFNHRMITKLPWITVKLATSLDGKTALANGKSQWITGLPARANVQTERAKSCAILSGADTVIADNPRLSVRLNELPTAEKAQFLLRQSQPLRVIIDGQNRLHDDYQIFNDGQPVLVFNAQHNARLNSVTTEQFQVPVMPAPLAHCGLNNVSAKKPLAARDYLDLQSIMQELGKRQINRVWTEAGPSLCGALFKAKLVNELIIYQAPILLGNEAKGTVDIGCIEHLEEAIKSKFDEVTKVGNDLKLRLLINS
jgi:diaminohydroxyphosphoribosylaminopyrimidine deaminase/5-amino-6-(5-phosphoribosylamino)uracil reductase